MKSWKGSYLAWDVETSGLGEDARIVEIATARFAGGELVGVASRLIDPELSNVRWTDPDVVGALEANRLTRIQLEQSVPFSECMAIVHAMFCDSDNHVVPVFVGHNVRFDRRILAAEVWRRQRWVKQHKLDDDRPDMLFGDLLDRTMICTMGLDLALRPDEKVHNLFAVCKRWGVPHGKLHRALEDAIACGRLLLCMMPSLPDDLEEVECMQNAAIDKHEKERARRRP